MRSGASTATGSRLSTSRRTGNTFATFATIIVDNVKPAAGHQRSEPPLIVKGSVDITFSADITDGGSGYDAKVAHDSRQDG